ncbi:MAG: hypothetical protein IJE01_01590 [Clostridia bacterium]|nr:hypothetical protein [Clostridia bacterium]
MPDKLTDSEIKKALECCYTTGTPCEDCPLCDIEECNDILMAEYVKDLINRQDFKIYQLEKQVSEIQNANLIDFKGTVGNYIAENESLKAEVERLQNILLSFTSKVTAWSNKKGYDTTELSLIAILDESKNVTANIKTEAYKECIEKVKTEIDEALKNNYKVRSERAQSIPIYTEDEFWNYCTGKIGCLRGLDDFCDNLSKELVGEPDES